MSIDSASSRPTGRPSTPPGVGARSRPSVQPLEGRRLLSFGVAVDYDIGSSPGGTVVADFNGDGRPDLAASGFNGVGVLLGRGDGTFGGVRFGGGRGSASLVAGDLNGDAKTDLVTRDDLGLGVLLGNGDGTFLPPRYVALPSQLPPGAPSTFGTAQSPTSVVLADLDADGALDLVAGGFDEELVGYEEYRRDGYVNVRLGNGDGTFGPNAAYRATPAAADTADVHVLGVADLDGDGRPDVLAGVNGHQPGAGGYLNAFSGVGDGTLRPAPRTSAVGYRTAPTAAPLADFDRDGRPDVLSWNAYPDGAAAVTVMRGAGDGTFHAAGLSPVGPPPGFSRVTTAVAIGDVNADGNPDVVAAMADVRYDEYQSDLPVLTRVARVLLGDGRGSFAPPASSNLGTLGDEGGFRSAVLADFDGDGSPDLGASDSKVYPSGISRGVVTVSRNDGSWTLSPPPPAPLPAIAIADVTRKEGNAGTTGFVFSVTLSAPSALPVKVNFTTANATATTAGADYLATSGTLTFAPGETVKAIAVPVVGDRRGEANETFLVNLAAPTNATIADGRAVGTIVDDEPRVTIDDVSKAEGNAGATLLTFTVRLSAAYDAPVSVDFATADGTAKVSDADYAAAAGRLTFSPGQTAKTVVVRVNGDKRKESDESFFVNLGGATNAVVADGQGRGTIANDDGSATRSLFSVTPVARPPAPKPPAALGRHRR